VGDADQVGAWEVGAAGVVELPGGRRVRGRKVSAPADPLPGWGLYVTWRAPEVSWPHRWVCWPDLGLPVHPAEARDAILEAWERSVSERVEVACWGGVGRTGTVLAAMAMLGGVGAEDAVALVRSRYHPRAVETPWQRWWLTSSGAGGRVSGGR
jgi:hypothetical protein